MTVRNFWIDAQIDGRTTMLSGGPRSKDGGFDLVVKIRDDDSIRRAVRLSGIARDDGTLSLMSELLGEGWADFGSDMILRTVR